MGRPTTAVGPNFASHHPEATRLGLVHGPARQILHPMPGAYQTAPPTSRFATGAHRFSPSTCTTASSLFLRCCLMRPRVSFLPSSLAKPAQDPIQRRSYASPRYRRWATVVAPLPLMGYRGMQAPELLAHSLLHFPMWWSSSRRQVSNARSTE
jgi:hypothetical protein